MAISLKLLFSRTNSNLPMPDRGRSQTINDVAEKAGRQLLSRDPRPTAIFAANDEMAFGVMHAAAEIGLKIPKDLSLVGFDGTSFSSFVLPALSTIRRQTDEMSRLGTQKLLALIDAGPDAAGFRDDGVATIRSAAVNRARTDRPALLDRGRDPALGLKDVLQQGRCQYGLDLRWIKAHAGSAQSASPARLSRYPFH